jgi:hypothetical protein
MSYIDFTYSGPGVRPMISGAQMGMPLNYERLVRIPQQQQQGLYPQQQQQIPMMMHDMDPSSAFYFENVINRQQPSVPLFPQGLLL